jgi:L-seryl-tRNA(Ser) seleniumtransferase
VEVGTTNRTYIRDYVDAVTEGTAALLKVHASNFKVVGFTHEPSLEELAEAGRARGVPVLYDLGSGCLLHTERFGLAHEPMPQEAIAAGADLVFFSGDKLLGGPQAGIVVGKAELVKKLEKHPLARAIRCDKVTLAALVATLSHYVKDEATRKVPIWRMVSATLDSLRPRAESYAKAAGAHGNVVEAQSAIGGGSLPGETLPTWAAALRTRDGSGAAANALAKRLRECDPPVVARVEADMVLLDPRTVHPEEDEAVRKAVRTVVRHP